MGSLLSKGAEEAKEAERAEEKPASDVHQHDVESNEQLSKPFGSEVREFQMSDIKQK